MRSTWLVLGVMLAVVQPAWAKPKVALVAFDGDKKGEAREVVSDLLADDVSVLGSKQVNRTLDELGFDATALTDKELRKLSRELEADAVIQAKLSTKGKDKLLRFRLFVHGKKAKGFKVEFGSLKSARFKQQLHDKLLERLGFAAPSDDDAAPPPDEAPPPSKTKKVPVGGGDDDDAAPVAKVKPAPKPAPSRGDDDDAPAHKAASPEVAHAAGGGGGDDDDSGGVTARVDVHPAHDDGGSSAHTPNRDAVRVDLGPSVSQRSLSFNSRVFDQAPKGYHNTIVPGGRIEGELYPFAFGNPDGIAAGIGVGGLYDQTVLLSLSTSIQPGTKFPVTQLWYSVGPRFRILFGHTPTSPSLTIGVGYGHRTFKVNRSALAMGNTLDIPDTVYAGFDPTLTFRLPLTAHLAISFGGGAILLTSTGAIDTQAQYGQATVTGGEGRLAFDILFTQRMGVRLAFDAAQIGFKFKGNGEMSNDRDGVPSSQDVGGAADRYFGGAATFAVFY